MHHIRTLVASEHYRTLGDGQLLTLFTIEQDQLAFRALVRRHGPLVLGICRRMLGDAADLDDVFQATFLVLARKASSIRRQPSVAGWLASVAFRLASRQRKRIDKRCKHEQPVRNAEDIAEANPMATDPAQRASVRELGVIVDQEVQRLQPKMREAMVLCHLEGLGLAEAAKRLNCPVPTLKRRLAKAREIMRQRLTRRGVTLSAAAAAFLFAEQAARATVPLKLVHAACRGGIAYAAKPVVSAAVSAQAALLAKGILKTSVIVKLTVVIAVLATGFGGLSTAVVLDRHARAAQAADITAEAPPAPPPAKQTPAQQVKQPVLQPLAKQAEMQHLRVKVLDSQDKPVADAKIHSSIWTDEKGFKANRDYQTDAEGVAQIELPKTYQIVRLWASKKSFASIFANWEQGELASGGRLPAEYIIRLEQAVTAGGRIVDEQGKPIEGADVRVEVAGDLKPVNGDGRARYDSNLANGAVKTDADGLWQIANVPNHPLAKLLLFISHPDFQSDTEYGGIQSRASVTTAMLREGTANLTLQRGVIVKGRVMEPNGTPIKDAIVIVGDRPYMTRLTSKFPTDADGSYKLPALAPGETNLTVMAPGWAPQMRKVKLQAGLEPQDFRMEPGKPIRLLIVDAAGKPIPKAYVSIVGWKGSESIESMHNPNHPKVPDTKIPRQSDADGKWEWLWAPDSPVKLQVALKGYPETELEIEGGAPLRTVTLAGALKITGRVTDRVTGKPIPTFTVIPVVVFHKDLLAAERGHALVGKDGQYSFVPDRSDVGLRLRIEAMGYKTQDGPEFRLGQETARTQDFQLEPSPPLTGVVLDPNGQPLANAEVQMATPAESATITSDFRHKLFTDAEGRFAFPDPGEACAVLARAEGGFAHAEFPAGQHDLGKLRLQPWASLRGQFHDAGKPVLGATVFLAAIQVHSNEKPRIDASMQTVTDAAGRFEFPRVPPGPVQVRVHLGPWEESSYRSGPSVAMDLKPGQAAELALGSGGATVKGKVTLTGKIPEGLDCTYSLNFLVRRQPGVLQPPEIADAGFDVRKGWSDMWTKTREGLAFLSTLQHWFVKLAPDGSFQISGVPAGEYDLAVQVYGKPLEGCLVDPLAQKVISVTVKAEDVARGELKLPEIATAVVPIPVVGDTPELTFQRADSTAGKLADYRDKYTVVHFWASWCGPCKQQLPGLKQIHERFAPRGLNIVSLALDDDAKAWQGALKRLDTPWQHGRLAPADAIGVSSVPTYWLLDSRGTIIARVYSADELMNLLPDHLK
jgi:RNA polymerase sigma factor (sigma-70 family)